MLRAILSMILAAVMVIPGSQVDAQGLSGWCQGLSTGAPVIDALGDSLTEGGSVPDLSLHWTSLLAQSFRSDGYPGTQIWTGGAIPGSATADYVPGAKYSGHTEFTVNHPNLITLAWGTNDWAGGISPATFRAQYQAIIDRIRVLTPGSTILIIHMPWVYNQGLVSTRGDQADYLIVEKDLARVNGLKFFGAEWGFRADGQYQQYTQDQVHHTVIGQGFIYSALRGYLLGLC